MADIELLKRGAQRTGRSAAVRAFLETQTKAVSARQIVDAVEPGGDINLMTATLATLLRNNAVEKHGAGLGRVRWKALPVMVRDCPAARATDVTVHAVKQRSPASKPQRRSPTMVHQKQPANREQKTNFPSCTPSRRNRTKAATGNFETVEEFLRRGGRIQVLRRGECSQPLHYDHSRYADYRAKGRATQKRNRADKGD